MKGEYYLGLDMGSSSVGWAVTNEKYEILRAHGKTLWGVRLFDSAQTAEERRGFRTAKRRLDRRNWRIELLQKIFAEEVEKIDDGFFRRMKESRYWDQKDSSTVSVRQQHLICFHREIIQTKPTWVRKMMQPV